jgi:hypothetical protein
MNKPGKMKIAIMQPYIFPYLGYYQLLDAVDTFVFFDDVNFINKGWINRNNILLNNRAHLFSIPLKAASQNKLISEIEVSEDGKWREKFLKTVEVAYKKAEHYSDIYPIVESVIHERALSIGNMAANSIKKIADFLELPTDFIFSSSLEYNKKLKAQDKILELNSLLSSTVYINPINGTELYEKGAFEKKNTTLLFIKMEEIKYNQFKNDNFVSHLSMLDVLMFNSKDEVRKLLKSYTLI